MHESRLVHQGRLLVARVASAGPAVESPVCRLLRGVHEVLPPGEALRAVRARIVTTLAPTPACRGAVKVAGKRLSWEDAAPPGEGEDVGAAADEAQRRAERALEEAARAVLATSTSASVEEMLSERVDREGAGALVRALARAIPRDEARFRSDRPVAALLFSREGRLLSAGVNAVARNRCLHAEANLVRRLQRRTGRGIPAGARLVVSLTPCKMCAGIIWCAAESPASLEVRFLEADPGRAARGTVLERASNERRAAARGREEREAEILARER